MNDQTPTEMREVAKRLRGDAGRQGTITDDQQAQDERAGADALDRLADVIEWALDEDSRVIDYESYAMAQEDALTIARGEPVEKTEGENDG